MPDRNHFSPLTDGHIPVETDRDERKDFYQQTYPVTSLCTCIAGVALIFGGLWLMQYSGHFLWGTFFIVVGLCLFIYGLGGVFDFVEITTK